MSERLIVSVAHAVKHWLDESLKLIGVFVVDCFLLVVLTGVVKDLDQIVLELLTRLVLALSQVLLYFLQV